MIEVQKDISEHLKVNNCRLNFKTLSRIYRESFKQIMIDINWFKIYRESKTKHIKKKTHTLMLKENKKSPHPLPPPEKKTANEK